MKKLHLLSIKRRNTPTRSAKKRSKQDFSKRAAGIAVFTVATIYACYQIWIVLAIFIRRY